MRQPYTAAAETKGERDGWRGKEGAAKDGCHEDARGWRTLERRGERDGWRGTKGQPRMAATRTRGDGEREVVQG